MAAKTRVGDAMDRAVAAFRVGRNDEAAALCHGILQEDPAHFFALHLAAVLALQSGEHERAVELATRALRVKPGHEQVLANRGAALRALGRYDEAVADYATALATAPDAIEVRNNLGVALAALGRHEEALEQYRHVLAIAPRRADVLHNRGVSLAALERHAEALGAYTQALQAQPDYSRARWNRGLLRLAMGDFAEGFADYEARHALDDRVATAHFIPGAHWTGREPVAGKTILLLSEQGFGDCILFSRFARSLHEQGARVLLQAPASLASLLEQLPYFDAIIPTGSPPPSFDLQCPLASLPHRLGTRLESIPAQSPPIAAPRASLERWTRRLERMPRPRVGIAWSGGTRLSHDDPRAIPLATLGALRELPASFIALQKDISPADRAVLERSPAVAHFEDAIGDFADTAALATLVDVVVSIDTAVAHLAGAMGRPTWIMLPHAADWRWLLDREDSPWYPSVRLFRQSKPGEWLSLVQRVAAELRRA